MSHATTVAELSLSLSHVQSLLKQITAEVKVLTDGIAVLVELEETGDLEAELDYLDVDPWSKVNDKDKTTATGAATAAAARRDSIRSLLQRRPSTVKDETKALARILSHKHTGASGTGSGSESENKSSQHQQSQQYQQQQQQQHQQGNSKWSASNLQDQVIEEDSPSSEGSNSFQGGQRSGEKQELDYPSATGNDASAYMTIQSLNIASTPSATSTIRLVEAERVPHTISVQTAHIPKYSLAISKPAATPVLSTSSSQGSILGAFGGGSGMFNNNSNVSGLNNSTVQPPYHRSQTAPNADINSSRPGSASDNFAHGDNRSGSASSVSRSFNGSMCVPCP